MKKIFCILLFCSSLLLSQQKLVVLDPASIETIYLLEAEDSILAIAKLQHSNIYPEDKTKDLPSVGSFSNPSLEKIIKLNPSLVILSSYSLNLEESLKNIGIKTLYLQANRLEDLEKNITTLAKILNKEQKGKELIATFHSQIKELQQNPINKSAIFLYSSNPLMAFPKDSLMSDILKIIGIDNLAAPTNIKRPILTSESILKSNPDLLIVGAQSQNLDDLVAINPVLKNTKAYQNDNIYPYPSVFSLLRVSPRITQKIQDLKSKLQSQP